MVQLSRRTALRVAGLSLTVAFPASPQQRQGSDGRRIAVVIGNGAYRAIPLLANPPNDARSVADALEQLGFHSELLLDASREEMLIAIRQFGTFATGAEAACCSMRGTPRRSADGTLGEVRRSVREATAGRQILWDNSSREGDFYFRPTPSGSATGITQRTFAAATAHDISPPAKLRAQLFRRGTSPAAALVGSWSSGDGRWAGRGRQIMLVVLSADEKAGTADIVYAQGLPSEHSYGAPPPVFCATAGPTANGGFLAFYGWRYTFRLASDDELEGWYLAPLEAHAAARRRMIRMHRVE